MFLEDLRKVSFFYFCLHFKRFQKIFSCFHGFLECEKHFYKLFSCTPEVFDAMKIYGT